MSDDDRETELLARIPRTRHRVRGVVEFILPKVRVIQGIDPGSSHRGRRDREIGR